MADNDVISDLNKAHRPSGSPGKTQGSSLKSGLSEHSQITSGPTDIGQGVGQGQRPTGRAQTKVEGKLTWR